MNLRTFITQKETLYPLPTPPQPHSPRQPPIYFLSLWDGLFWTLHVGSVTQNVSFCASRILLTVIWQHVADLHLFFMAH